MEAAEELRRLISRERVGKEAGERLLAYLRLLEKWNRKINLTARTDWGSIGPLFQEAIWAAGLAGEPAGAHLDIGSGAGFPALPMAALHPQTGFELVESRAKRAAFLEEAARRLGLERVRVREGRLSEYLAAGEGASGWGRVSWKGVRIGRVDAELLLERGTASTEFWLFHGAELPLEDARGWTARTRRERCEKFPGKSGWALSIFRRR